MGWWVGGCQGPITELGTASEEGFREARARPVTPDVQLMMEVGRVLGRIQGAAGSGI